MKNRGRENTQVNTVKLALIVILAALGIGLTVGLLVSQPVQQWTNPEAWEAKQEATLSLRVAGAVTWELVSIGLIVGGFAGVLYAGWIGLSWLNRLSRRTYSQDGLYPILETRQGYYDPNRDNIGAHPRLTYESMQIQKQAAIRADKLSVNVKNDNSAVEALTQEDGPTLPDLLPASQIAQSYSLDALTIGQSEQGLIQESLYNMMHLLSVGASGWGKSSLLRYLLFQFAQVREPLDILAIDINGSEFNLIRQWDKLLYPVARDVSQAVSVLGAFSQETQRRKALYEAYPMAFDLPSYNALAAEKLTPQVLLIDEGTNLLNQDGIGDPLREAAQTSRQYGQYIMMTGQNAKGQVLDTQTRDNFTSRLCFHTSKPSYRVVLDESVDVLNVKGRAWAQLPGRELTQVQVPFTSKQQLLNALTMGKPRNDFPEVPEVSIQDGGPVLIEDDPDLPEVDRVKLLHSQGLSNSEIERRVFGFAGGAAYRKVKDILG